MENKDLTTLLGGMQNVGQSPEALALLTSIFQMTTSSMALLGKMQNVPIQQQEPAQPLLPVQEKKQAPLCGRVKFTRKELAQMPKELQLYFIHDRFIVHYYIIPEKGIYHARLRKCGYKISVYSKDYEIMKQKFINEFNRQTALMPTLPILVVAPPPVQEEPQTKTVDVLFKDYGEQWLETKKALTKPSTFKDYDRTFHKDLLPLIGDMKLSEVTRMFLQNELLKVFENTPKKAEKMHLQLSCIFNMAEEDFQIRNPMKKVVLPYRESKKGSALTKEEERIEIDYCIAHPDYATTSAILVLHLFGLRTSELKTLRVIDDNWIECITSKEKKGKDEVPRRIPITPFARQYLKYIDFKKAAQTVPRSIASTINRIFPRDKVKAHHPHELRYTFITRCKECGVNPELVMLWDGHEEDKDVKSSKVDRGYTDFSEEYQLAQASLVNYEV